MKKLKVYNDNSYMPLWQQDLGFMQEGFSEALSELLRGMRISNAILWGCEVSFFQGRLKINEGAVVINGEVLRFFAYDEMFFFAPEGIYLTKDTNYYEDGEKLFKTNDGTEFRQTYAEGVAVVFNFGTPTSDMLELTDEKRLMNILKSIIAPVLPAEGGAFPLSIAFTNMLSFSEAGIVYYKRYSNGGWRVYVEKLTFVLEQGENGLVNGVAYTLPVGYRPSHEIPFVVYNKNTQELLPGLIKTDGRVTINIPTNNISIAPFNFPVS